LVLEEKAKLDIEKNKEKAIIDNLKNQTKDEGSDKDNIKVLFQDLYYEAKSDFNDNNSNNLGSTDNTMTGTFIKKKDDINIKELVDILKKKENQIIGLIFELEKISKSDPEIFKVLTTIRKDKNKETKINALKANQKYCKIYKFI